MVYHPLLTSSALNEEQRALQRVELRQSFTPNIVVAAAAVVVVFFFEFQFFLMSIYNINLYLKGGGLTTPHALLP